MRIRDGHIETRLLRAWIGDKSAFDAYQAFRSAVLATPEIQTLVADLDQYTQENILMLRAFEKAVDDPHIHTVGNLMIRVLTDPQGLQYAPSATMIAGRSRTIPPNVPTTIQFGEAPEGGFAVSVLTPTRSGVGAVGAHFHQGRVGVLFYPLESSTPIVFPKVSHDEFRAEVYERFGLHIQGPVIS